MNSDKEAGKSSASSPSESYAVFESGGCQHIARLGLKIDLDRLDAKVGDKVVFSNVLLVSDQGKVAIGAPYVDGKAVEATVVEHGKGPKVRIIKFKRRKHHMKRGTARKHYTQVEIISIVAKGGSSAANTTAPAKTATAPANTATAPAPAKTAAPAPDKTAAPAKTAAPKVASENKTATTKAKASTKTDKSTKSTEDSATTESKS